MIPIMAAQMMSFADVQYRQAELAEEFARVRRGRARRAQRRAARHARAAAAAPVLPSPARTVAGPALTRAGRGNGPATTGIPTQATTDRSVSAAATADATATATADATVAAGQRRPAA
jgi:hypothetical protein